MATSLKQLGPYEIVRPLGQGGMGAVFVARHKELGCLRAVKVVEANDPKRVARFEREVTALAKIRHPSVVRVHDAGRQGPFLFFAMELIDRGQPLDKVLTALPLERALAIVEGSARGIHALHEAGLIHRDVKPANIVLDGSWAPTVIDLGLVAGDSFDRLTKTGTMLGTLQYMAPEQALTLDPPDPRNDIYALGAILYEAITGFPVIEAQSAQELMMALAQRAIVPPSEKKPGLPASLDTVCMRALARNKDERYPTALALADDIHRVREGQEPLASAELGIARPRKKLGLAVLAVALVAAAAILVEARLARARTRESCKTDAHALHAFLREPWSIAQTHAVLREKEALETAERARALGEDAACREAADAAAALALRRRDANAARSAAATFLGGQQNVPAIEAGIAFLTTDAALAEKLLGPAIELEADRGDLLLWRAVARARLGERDLAKKDQEAASALRFEDSRETLVLLALLGDPEQARRAIAARPELRDTAFAIPFAKKAVAYVKVRGRWAEALEATRTAAGFAPPNAPELVPIARAANEALVAELRPLFDDAFMTADAVWARIPELSLLSTCAEVAAPLERAPELARVIVSYAVLRQDGSDLRLALFEIAVRADPDSYLSWIGLAHTRRFQRKHDINTRTREALARARALVRNPHDEVEVLIETAEQQDRNEIDTAGAVETATTAFQRYKDASLEDTSLRGAIVVDLAGWCTALGRWEAGLAWSDVAQVDRQGPLVATFRSKCHEALGDLDAAIEDLASVLRDGTFSQYERVQNAVVVEALMRKAKKSLEEIDAVWASIGHAEWDEPRKVALHRAALALEAGNRDQARRFLDAAAHERGDGAPVKLTRAALDEGGDPTLLRQRILALAD